MARTKPFNKQQNREFAARARSVINKEYPGASIDELSSHIGIEVAALALLLNGKRHCSTLNATKIALATGAPILWLVFGNDQQPATCLPPTAAIVDHLPAGR